MSDSCDPMSRSPTGSSVHGILQARILEGVAFSLSRGTSWPRNWTQVSCIAGRCLTNWAMQEALGIHQFSSVQFSHSVVSDSLRPRGLQHTRPPCPSPTLGSLPKLMSIESVMPANHLIFYHPLLLLPSIFPSIGPFSNESALCIRLSKCWSSSFSISPSSECSGLISYRIDWFNLLAVEGTLKGLFQHHSWKASILWHSAVFMVQLTSVHDYYKNHSFGYTNLCW